MYARELMIWLHERLANAGTLNQTEKRFESLRGYGLLPRGRENAGKRLSDEEIANAVLSFGHQLPGYGGHASLILGNLCPVGGDAASYLGKKSLRDVVATLVGGSVDTSNLVRVVLSVERDFGDEDYSGAVWTGGPTGAKVISYVSKNALSLLQPGAEHGYDHARIDRFSAVERVLSPKFFKDLQRIVKTSRHLDLPMKTDWREYQTEEEKTEFYRKLGARNSSNFLNLRVDGQVTWPREPTKLQFGGYDIVLFPKTKDHSHSVSIDLAQQRRISQREARTLISRMLSVMAWCDDQPVSLHEGWSGNPVPVPVPRRDIAPAMMSEWHFYRSLSLNDSLLQCLAYFRDGLNADSVGLGSHAVLSFFRVFETKYDTKAKAITWINSAFQEVLDSIDQNTFANFEADRSSANIDVGTYIYGCRVATAHAARDKPSDPDGAEELRRLLNASEVIRCLARYFISEEFCLSSSYLSD